MSGIMWNIFVLLEIIMENEMLFCNPLFTGLFPMQNKLIENGAIMMKSAA